MYLYFFEAVVSPKDMLCRFSMVVTKLPVLILWSRASKILERPVPMKIFFFFFLVVFLRQFTDDGRHICRKLRLKLHL